MSIIKVPMDTGFFQISNQAVSDFIEDGSNWNALALLCYLASKPDYWEVSYEGIRAQTGASREKIAKSLGALQDYGYARKMRKRTEHGTLQGTQWEVCGKPIFTAIVRKTERRFNHGSVNHSSENRSTVKPRQVKKVVSKEDIRKETTDRAKLDRTTEITPSAAPKPQRAKRATSCPFDPDVFPDDLRDLALEKRPQLNGHAHQIWESFVCYHQAKGSTMKDWRAAWRTWFSREQGKAPQRQRELSPYEQRRQRAEEWKRKAVARMNGEEKNIDGERLL